ncbi:HlyD family secretion protein [Hufsiella ginkgonis]|uniref:HlyD family efflux transporter periplasmic adaptor subunit n=1 Tax=Hufsiella ginkgonis TaxID=2695274 RepID=A0A7K1XTQ6_9SPHI|nr:HlyD family efflux transporter periplasmic adaptor subunit [Hufsiella ginkgonis]MXV13896.1 HlyD family efflux transporter periplasmic adaptor subunit [Hufsiella ginkgonis]
MEVTEEQAEYQSEMQEIIAAQPPWLVQWSMTILFLMIIMFVGLSAMIRYPDVVRSDLKINAEDAPKPVVAKVTGKLVRLLVADNAAVKRNQPLAFLESDGNPEKILTLYTQLTSLQKQLVNGENLSTTFLDDHGNFELGELQASYQEFYQSFLDYKSAVNEGFRQKKKAFLAKDIQSIDNHQKFLVAQLALQEKEYDLAVQEFEMHKKLLDEKVEARMEFKREEAKFLATQYPVRQTRAALSANRVDRYTKEKEIMELEEEVSLVKSTFFQAVNREVSEIEKWKNRFMVVATQAGRLEFSEVVQENQVVNEGQSLFYITPGNSAFFGILRIPQFSMGKVRKGQEVLIKLKGFPYEEYGIIHGHISYINEVPFRDSIFTARVKFSLEDNHLRQAVNLKTGMIADAEIITQEASVLKRLMRNVIRAIE